MSGTWSSGWVAGDIVTAAEYKKSVGLIADSTLGGDAASIDFTGLPTTYNALLVLAYLRGDTAAASVATVMRFNNDTGANYDYQLMVATGATVSGSVSFGQTVIHCGNMPANSATANIFNAVAIYIPHYAGTTNNKAVTAQTACKNTTADAQLSQTGGWWRSNAAINRITIFANAGNLRAGSRVSVYALGV